MFQPSSSPARRNLLGWVSLCALILVVGFREIRSTVLAKELESSFLNLEQRTRVLPQGEIVFTGASSVAYWDSLGGDMKPLQVVNTAYGGAEYTDLNPQIDKLVVAYHPVAVVVYAGDNDLATPSSKTPQSVAGDAMHFVDLVHAQLLRHLGVCDVHQTFVRALGRLAKNERGRRTDSAGAAREGSRGIYRRGHADVCLRQQAAARFFYFGRPASEREMLCRVDGGDQTGFAKAIRPGDDFRAVTSRAVNFAVILPRQKSSTLSACRNKCARHFPCRSCGANHREAG